MRRQHPAPSQPPHNPTAARHHAPGTQAGHAQVCIAFDCVPHNLLGLLRLKGEGWVAGWVGWAQAPAAAAAPKLGARFPYGRAAPPGRHPGSSKLVLRASSERAVAARAHLGAEERLDHHLLVLVFLVVLRGPRGGRRKRRG